MIAPTITLHNVSLKYHECWLFRNLNLTLPAAKWTCLLGPSGVGKTSLLRLIAGLKNDADITFDYISASDNTSLTGRLSYLAQHDALLPWLTVIDNVLISIILKGSNKKSYYSQAAHLLTHVGLKDAMYKLPAQLSGGMRQRVSLARTLFENKSIVLMDEPFASLDVVTRMRLQELAAELLKNKTVLLVTHDPLEALRLGDQVIIMTGMPAKLSAPIIPVGEKPRDPTNPELLALQAELLHQLMQARIATPW